MSNKEITIECTHCNSGELASVVTYRDLLCTTCFEFLTKYDHSRLQNYSYGSSQSTVGTYPNLEPTGISMNIETYRKLPKDLKRLSIPRLAFNYCEHLHNGENNLLEEAIFSDSVLALKYHTVKKKRIKHLEQGLLENAKKDWMYMTSPTRILLHYMCNNYKFNFKRDKKEPIFREGLKFLTLRPDHTYTLATQKRDRLVEGELILLHSFRFAYDYCCNIVQGPLRKFELFVNKSIENFYIKGKIDRESIKAHYYKGTSNTYESSFAGINEVFEHYGFELAPELLHELGIKTPDSTFNYDVLKLASKVKYLCESFNFGREFLYDYALDIKESRWKEIEVLINEPTESSVAYITTFIKKQVPAIETCGLLYRDSSLAIKYIDGLLSCGISYLDSFEKNMKKACKEGLDRSHRNIIDHLLHEAQNDTLNLGKDFEALISSDSGYSLLYAKGVLKGRFPEGETSILASNKRKDYLEFLQTLTNNQ